MSSKAGARQALQRAGGWLSRVLLLPQLPLLAVEVRPRAVSAVRLAAKGSRVSLEAAASSDMPAGTLDVSLTKPNVVEPASFRAALRSTLERVGALAGGPLSLVLPDPAVRVALIPADGLRGRAREIDETVRFRMHKALPFDVRTARLVWQLAGSQVLVAVTPEDVVAGYEAALEELGYDVGLVEPACLALAEAAAPPGTSGNVLLVNWDFGYVSFVVLRDGLPVLVRTLPGDSGPDAVGRHAGATLQFSRDRLGVQELSRTVVRSAALPGEEAVALIERALGVVPELLQPWAALGLAERGDAAQAVAGAAATASRRAA